MFLDEKRSLVNNISDGLSSGGVCSFGNGVLCRTMFSGEQSSIINNFVKQWFFSCVQRSLMISCEQPFSEEQHSRVCIYCSIPNSAGLYPDRWFPDGKQPRILANKEH
jgi:hypothetical protein